MWIAFGTFVCVLSPSWDMISVILKECSLKCTYINQFHSGSLKSFSWLKDRQTCLVSVLGFFKFVTVYFIACLYYAGDRVEGERPDYESSESLALM